MRILVFLLLVSTACAVTRHVPSEYATIQSALNAVHNGDTVLVALGTYSEALFGPPRSFVLKGDVVTDTGDYPRPVIDPSWLSNPQDRACLTLAGPPWQVVEDLRFRNGPAMYPHSPGVGGVMGGAAGTILRRCVFDSTAGGLSPGGNSITLEGCRFVNVQGYCVYPAGNPYALHATDCQFQGRALFNIHVEDSSTFVRCQFLGNPEGSMCLIYGRGFRVEDCIFGPVAPQDASFDPALWIEGSGIVQHNLFQSMRTGWATLLIGCDCVNFSPMVIRGNRFIDIEGGSNPNQAAEGIAVGCTNAQSGMCHAVIDSNIFYNVSDTIQAHQSLFLRASAHVQDNRFGHTHQYQSAKVTVRPPVDWAQLTGYELRRNLFDTLSTAVEVNHTGDTLDARWNWWGSDTGPYHVYQNPFGRGDTVSDHVAFEPWCMDTVECEEPNAADPAFTLPPSSFSLTAYPNPFNNTTLIRLQVPQAEIVNVELFDLLGRRVQQLWSGLVADQKEIAFDGSSLASGAYFVRATNTIWNRPLVTTKLVLLK